jgi:hypothetical protein
METLKQFLVEGWKAKLVSLFIAISIWYLIKSNLDGARREFPVPGTTVPAAAPDDSILAPLIPAPVPVPVPIPVPGGDNKG